MIAILEKGARVVSAVHKRLHSSLKTELRMLGRLFGEDPTPYPYEVGQDQRIKAQDFDERVDVLPNVMALEGLRKGIFSALSKIKGAP